MTEHDPMLGVESWALEFSTLHPRVRVFLNPYFMIDLSTVRIRPTRLRGSIYALGGTVLFRRGTLNAEYYPPLNRGVDLATVGGMRIMAHEWTDLDPTYGYYRTEPRFEFMPAIVKKDFVSGVATGGGGGTGQDGAGGRT